MAAVARTRPQYIFNGPLDAGLLWICRHWLTAFNVFMVTFASLPVLVPLLSAAGLTAPADLIFQAYSTVCHQMASRSYWIAGHVMAYCERNTAIYGTMALCGLGWRRF